MRNWIIVCFFVILWGMPLPGHAADDARVLATYAQWKHLRDLEAPLPDFDQAYAFLKNHPNWPQEKLIRSRAEAAAMLHSPPLSSPPQAGGIKGGITAYCTEFPPISGRGMIACLNAKPGDAKLLQQAWITGDFNDDEERRILSTYGSKLTAADHLARINRLLYDEKTTAAKRMLPRIAPQYQLLMEARIALIERAPNVAAKLHNVPAKLKNDPGLMLDRIEWRAKKGLEDGVVELFLQAPANPPYADRWWPLRASTAREALKERKYDMALKILQHHGDLTPENLAEAQFLKGWIRMEFKHDLRTAYKDFYALYKTAGTPVSKARAAYWAARAASRNGNADIALQWYKLGAKYPTVFYGQLARHAMLAQCTPPACSISRTLELPAPPVISDALRAQMAANELVQLLPLLDAPEDKKLLPLFLKALADAADSPEQLALVGELAVKHADLYGGVKVAKHALRKNIVLTTPGWPVIALPDTIGTEPALALAIIRQESEFDPLARSSADARGLMQLLPSTAKQMAKKMDISYQKDDLWHGRRNITLGSNYLGRMVDGFDGSYILAIAAYNAGPGNVRKWLALQGWPPKDEAGAVNWVESIPYAETRNYVMRVLENLQIYRQLREPNHPLELHTDLVR